MLDFVGWRSREFKKWHATFWDRLAVYREHQTPGYKIGLREAAREMSWHACQQLRFATTSYEVFEGSEHRQTLLDLLVDAQEAAAQARKVWRALRDMGIDTPEEFPDIFEGETI